METQTKRINKQIANTTRRNKEWIAKLKKNKFLKNIYRDRYLYLLIAPMIVWLILFKYRPLYGLQIAFKDYSLFKGIEGSPWVGLQNFYDFFNGPYFLKTLKNTFILNFMVLIISFPIPIILALLINEIKSNNFKKVVQTATYLPHFISAVVVAGIVINMLGPSSGVINIIIEKLGFEKVYFLTKPEYFRGIFTTMEIWQESGFNSIVFLAALSGIDQELYEAARVDGANKWKQIINVTIPGILPAIMIMLIIKVGNILNLSFEKIILLYQPATYETADVLSTYVYRTGLVDANYSLGAAVGLFEAVIAFVLVFGANRISRKFTETSLW